VLCRARLGDRREQLLEPLAQVLVLPRKTQRLTEVGGILVDGEAWGPCSSP
jgi:hypothetical protein